MVLQDTKAKMLGKEDTKSFYRCILWRESALHMHQHSPLWKAQKNPEVKTVSCHYHQLSPWRQDTCSSINISASAFAIDIKKSQRVYLQILRYSSLTIQILAFCEFTFILPVTQEVFCSSRRDWESQNPSTLHSSEEPSSKNYIPASTQLPQEMEAKKSVVKMMAVEFPSKFVMCLFCKVSAAE